ncbi:putative SAM-dependent methyltransferase RsmB/NOP2-type, RNA (C5-cytosine) methyltransferase [Plasmopara halstedii]
MGKRSRNGRSGGRGGGRGSKKSRAYGAVDDWRTDRFADWVYENENFDAYYKSQNIMADTEWDAFKKALATPLPTTFRINSSCPFADRIREHIEQDFKFDGLVVDDKPVDPISSLPWYPDNRGFTWSVERRRVRKLPILKEFQSWLIELSNSGSITRQEAVSMIPPLVLGVEPHHKVLDMCAAPGSKTSQLLESLHSQDFATGKTPTGVVVANDVDIKRAYMLVHQSKRMSSPALLVTCHEAQNIPFLGKDGLESEGVFDRILCDAPCSGDGTLRKNPLIWKTWSAKNGIALHPLQLQIVKRGAALLKIGGKICYSTCSFNPIENEAVVAELLRWGKGSLELVDVSNTLSRLKRRSGISTWKVMNSRLKEYSTYESYVEENIKEKSKDKIRFTMFPPTENEALEFHLERCMRCLPQDENTGGFFICLLKKVAATPNDKEELRLDVGENALTDPKKLAEVELNDVATLPTEVTASDIKPHNEVREVALINEVNTHKSRRYDRMKKNGEVYVSFRAEYEAHVRDYYDITTTFSAEQLITRSEDAKSVTFVTESITMALLEEMKRKKMQVVYAGLKMFERNETTEGGKVYRVCQAGLPHILPFMNKCKAMVGTRDFQMMLERLGDLLDFDEFEPDTREYLENAPIGSVVCMLDRPGQSTIESRVMNLVVWRGRNSVNVMASKADVAILLGTMKELKIYNLTIHEAIIEAKKVKDAERAARDVDKAVATKETRNDVVKMNEADAVPTQHPIHFSPCVAWYPNAFHLPRTMERLSTSSVKMRKSPDQLVTPTFTCEVCKISVRSAQKLIDHVNFSPLHQASLGLNKGSKAGIKSAGCVRRLLYDGSNLFWRANETLDVCIYEDLAVNRITIRAFQQKPPQNMETDDVSSLNSIPPLEIDLRRLRQVLGIDAAPKNSGYHSKSFGLTASTMLGSTLTNQSICDASQNHSSELITEYLLARLQARRDSLDRVHLYFIRNNDDELDPNDLLLKSAETPKALPSDLTIRRRHTIDDVKEAQKEVSVATVRLKHARMKAEELSNLAHTTLDNYSRHFGSATTAQQMYK